MLFFYYDLDLFSFQHDHKIFKQKGAFIMCGIIGYIGQYNCVPYLVNSLEKLEYRGYDSAGIAILNENHTSVIKCQGRLQNLKDKLAQTPDLYSNCGIGHTRWATHGEPSDINSHPHTSQSGLFSIVHNGIIENYAELKTQLIHDGYVFVSQTDTEVIAHLLEKNYNGDLLQTMKKTSAMLDGAFALGVMCRDFPDTLICTRFGSPLIIGESATGNFISSDITAILPYTKQFYKLDAGDYCVLKKDSLEFFDSDIVRTEKEVTTVNWSVEDAQKSGYEHFMFKEIMQQPTAIADTISPRIKDGKIVFENLSLTAEKIKNFNKIYIVACGSAYHVGVIGKYVFEKMTRISVEVDIASEFRYRDPIVDENTLCIIISQSGETADTLAALREAKSSGAHILSIVNVVGSSIAHESDDVLYTVAGPEIAVATTKAYSTQVSLIYLLSAFFANQLGKLSDNEVSSFLQEVQKIPDHISKILAASHDNIQELAKICAPLEHAYFIGRNLDYACAVEASLKMKEISYIHSEAYGAGELKHGTISLIEKGTLVVALASNDAVFAKTMSGIKEVTARGAKILIVTTKTHAKEVQDLDYKIILPDIHPLLMPSVQIIPLQLLSYYTAKQRNCDIDKPRNLAKSVTVE